MSALATQPWEIPHVDHAPLNAQDRAYRAKPDGSDAGPALFAFLTDVAASGRGGVIPPGRYFTPDITFPLPSTADISLQMDGVTFYRTSNTVPFWVGGGTKTTLPAGGGLLLADAAVGAVTLNIASTAALVVGDYLNLRSTVAWPGSSGGKVGEQCRVLSIVDATHITLFEPIREAYTVAGASIVNRINFRNPVIRGKFIMEGVQHTGLKTGGARFAYLGPDTVLEHVVGRKLDNPALQLDTCLGFDFTVSGYDLSDDVGISPAEVGYTLNLNGATQNVRCIGGESERIRHASTTNGSADGVPHDNEVLLHVTRGSTTTAHDSHEDGRGNRWALCRDYGSVGSYKMRAPDSQVIDCLSDSFSAAALNVESSATGCKVRGFDAKNNLGNARSVNIVGDDCEFEGTVDNGAANVATCSGNIWINGANRPKVKAHLKNPGIAPNGVCVAISGSPDGGEFDLIGENAKMVLDVGTATPTSIKIRPRNLSSVNFIDGAKFNGGLGKTVTVGASPFLWTNDTGIEVDLVIVNGTVTDVRRSQDGTNFTYIGAFTGTLRVQPGASVKVTYTVTPNMTFLPVKS